MSDYIEREAALAVCQKEYEERLSMADWCGDTAAWNIGSAIKNMPAADVAPVRHGRWIGSEMNFGYCDIIQKEYIAKKYICSECGYETGDQAKKFVCCPICMARMDKEDEHETD